MILPIRTQPFIHSAWPFQLQGAGQKLSLGATWGGARRMLSEAEALRDVLNFVWDAHKERRPRHKEQTRTHGIIPNSKFWLGLFGFQLEVL